MNEIIKHQEFSITYGSLNTYVEQNAKTFIPNVIGRIGALEDFTIFDNVKTSQDIPILDDIIKFVPASSCTSFVDYGTSSMDKVTVTVIPLKVERAFCLEEMERYFPNWFPQGSNHTTVPQEQAFMDSIWTQIAYQVEYNAFNSGDGVTGVIAAATASGCTVLATQSFAVSTAANNGIIATLDNMVANINSKLRSQNDLIVYVGNDAFDNYTLSVRNLNWYHFSPDEIDNGAVKMFGKRNVKIRATAALDGKNMAWMHKSAWTGFGYDKDPLKETPNSGYDLYLDKYIFRIVMKYNTVLIRGNMSVLAKA